MLNRKNRWHKWLCLAFALVLCFGAGQVSAENSDLEALEAQPISLMDIRMPVSAECLAAQVHYGAYANSFVVGRLENGRKIEILEETRDYYKVDCYGCKGYIAKELVTQDENGDYYVNLTEGQKDVVSMDTFAASYLEALRTEIVELTYQQIGSRYRMGATHPGAFDCSGLVYYVFGETTSLPLARRATPQFQEGIVVDPQEALPGDLVFFYGTDGSGTFITHVGIYIGNREFIHASSSRGVIVASLDNSYWQRCFRGIRRVMLPASTLRTMDLSLVTE